MKDYGQSVILGDVPVSSTNGQAASIAAVCLEAIRTSGAAPDEAVERLCALAASDDRNQAASGAEAIFKGVVEPLSDQFRRGYCDAYIRFFSKVIGECREKAAFAAVDRCLSRFALGTTPQMAARAGMVRGVRRFTAARGRESVERIVVLSRVTLGADIAVTSVAIDRLKRFFPSARIDLIGGSKTGAFFASDSRVRLTGIDYQRTGTLHERLETWVDLAEMLAEPTEDRHPGECLIVDPDSRLTQLGLLPLTTDDSNYYFFESRSYSAPGMSALGALTSRWLDEVFPLDSAHASYPYVSLSEDALDRGRKVRATVGGPLAAVNLGVGGDPAKRVSDPFEQDLLHTLLASGYRLLLDRGAGEEELQRTQRLLDRLEASGKTIAAVDSALPHAASADVLVWEGSLSGFGGLVASADLYAGYDSAGGHLAAALGVPVIDVFTAAAPERMKQRWTPWGRAPVHVITADASNPSGTIGEVEAAVRERRK